VQKYQHFSDFDSVSDFEHCCSLGLKVRSHRMRCVVMQRDTAAYRNAPQYSASGMNELKA